MPCQLPHPSLSEAVQLFRLLFIQIDISYQPSQPPCILSSLGYGAADRTAAQPSHYQLLQYQTRNSCPVRPPCIPTSSKSRACACASEGGADTCA
jgi:hypothetical protein